ncbi:FERM domain-containing protein 7-like [Pristis pectinata]|uniref:FERM domain-containing protein 7-like n=1 Tax=Pristis pectinata TaxID=685728 RepID=UPI00223D59C4|nr:FERM domain-containing protein 7-like [Pristis pectinata]
MCESERKPKHRKEPETAQQCPGTTGATQHVGKVMQLRVLLLDDTYEVFEVEQKATGKVLFSCICQHLRLVEEDYFGVEFSNRHGNMVWLDPLKPICKQIRGEKNVLFQFVVKFFPPDPGQLKEELTRYLFAQQIKRDLVARRLHCNDNSTALLLSHIIQAEVGNFDEELDQAHLRSKLYLPTQELLIHKIMKFHRKLVGLTSAECDTRLLDTARKLEMYGIRLHPANDGEGTQINLAVSHMGILVFQGKIKINTFNWAKIRKLSFKKKYFLIKLHSNIFVSCKDSLEFLMESRDTCKHFWKTCVEYHAFFRLPEEPRSKTRPLLYSKGSCFRYSGRTQKQLVEYMRKGDFKKAAFERRSCNIQSEEGSVPAQQRQLKEQTHNLGETSQLEDPKVRGQQKAVRRERKEPAVEIVFTTELERSKPEADPSSDALSGADASTIYIGASDTEVKEDPVLLQRHPQPFQTDRIQRDTDTGDPTHGNFSGLAITGQRLSDNFLNSPTCLPRSLRALKHPSLMERIVRPSSVARPVSLPACSCLANHELYQQSMMRSSYGNSLNVVKEEESHLDDSLRPPRRSHSQSDMKALGLDCAPELRPLAHYLPLSWRQNPNKLRPAHPAHVALQRREAIRTTERYISSGTESSDSDSEIISPYFHPCLFGKALRSSVLRGGCFPSVNLQPRENASFDLSCSEGTRHLTIYTEFI